MAILGAGEGLVRAAAFTVGLEYSAARGCPDAAELEALVTARLGRDPFSDQALDHVLVRLTLQGGSMDGWIEWRDSAGTWAGDQTLAVSGTDCHRLARAVGFALAVQIQFLTKTSAAGPDANVAPPPPEVETAPPVVVPPAAIASKAQLSGAPAAKNGSPSPASRSGPMFAAGAGPSIGFGMSSAPVLLGRLFGAADWQHVSLELAAEVSQPATTRRSDGAGFSQQLLLASAAGCAVITRWRACLVAKAGEVRMAGEINHPASAQAPVVEAGVRIGVVQRVGQRVFLTARADGLTNLIRWTARLDRVPVWTAPEFAAALGVDAGFRFP